VNAREFKSVRGEDLRVRRSESGHLVLERQELGVDWESVAPGQYAPSLLAELLGQDLKPVDERISDALDRLLVLAKEADDGNLVAVVRITRAFWATNALQAVREALVEVEALVDWEVLDADHE